MSIQKKINKIIRAFNKISMQDFVQISNFDNESGFYNKDEENKIGIKGHFITSPEVSSIFGIAMFNQFIEKNPATKRVHLLELGPGNGHLTKDILEQMDKHNIIVLSTTLLEKSQFFKKELSLKFSNIKNFSIISEIDDFYQKDDELVFIYSNEFLDAFGHKQYLYQNDQFNEIFITKLNNNYSLNSLNTIQSEYIKKEYCFIDFENNDILEHSPLIDFFIQNLNNKIDKFYFSTCDYGYTDYSKKSSLRIIRNHQKIDLFEFFEGVDYSFSVDFKRLNKLFEPNKSEVQSQSSFIKKYAADFFINELDNDTEIIKNLLTSSQNDQMGLIFKNFNLKNHD